MSVLHELAEVIGHDAAIRLGQHLGGTRLYIPHQMTDSHALVALLGLEQAQKLSNYYQGEHIELPSKQLFKQIQNEMMRRDYETLKSGGSCSRSDWLAIKYGVCRRQALNILREEDVGLEGEPVQAAL
ncbi:hypothetical protein [Zooshikella harenae]|uniref:Mor transcription activator domain-containing protein n=1 Tax=Zooshikella harenae TaxID=2827238 RepID=A0ABS5ZLM8_9GAMM|nr:hypothetical protein [Zooshikella harenae]MBU2714361.1 hypothetical protein [Zooshikella harenae]